MDFGISIERNIAAYFQRWLESSSWLGWFVANPLLSLALILLAIFLLGGLFKAVGRGSEWIWLFLFSLPWKLLQPAIDLSWRTLARGLGREKEYKIVRKKSIEIDRIRTREIIERLIEIETEQSLLLAELKHLTGIPEDRK
jgi:hypothetical protein